MRAKKLNNIFIFILILSGCQRGSVSVVIPSYADMESKCEEYGLYRLDDFGDSNICRIWEFNLMDGELERVVTVQLLNKNEARATVNYIKKNDVEVNAEISIDCTDADLNVIRHMLPVLKNAGYDKNERVSDGNSVTFQIREKGRGYVSVFDNPEHSLNWRGQIAYRCVAILDKGFMD